MHNLEKQTAEQQQQFYLFQQLKEKLVIVTIHDACPFFSLKIFKLSDELEKLDIKFNIALVPFFNEKEDLTSFPEFVEKIKSYRNCEIALHGLYHERKNCKFDNFHSVTKAAAEEEIRCGLEIFQEIKIKTNVFIPPAWKLNDSSLEILEKLGFKFSETQERLILISKDSFKKIKVPKVFNWDSTGYPEKNTINIRIDENRFQALIKQKPPIIRVALHPRDPIGALKEQKDMINRLKEEGYDPPLYSEVLQKLQNLLF
jgi:predicted deacetylase